MKSVSLTRNHSLLPGAPGKIDQAPPPPPSGPAEGNQSEFEHLRNIYELAPLAYLNFDSTGRILDFNTAAARLLDASREKDHQRPLADFFSPHHARRLSEHIEQSLTSPAPVVTRLRLRPGSGPAAGALMEMSTCPEWEGLAYRTLLMPVSGKTPVAQPADDAKFRALVENSTEVVCIGAPDGNIFYTTPSVRRVLGYEPAFLTGRNAFEIMRPDHAELARAHLRRLAATPTGTVIRLIVQVRHHDGSWKWLDGILTNLIDQPDIGGIVCNYRDITESRRAEDALRVSEQRYRLLSESLPEMISVRDDAGRVIYCNSHWCEFRGVSAGEAPSLDWTSGIPPEDLKTLTPPPWVSGDRQPWRGECRFRRASDGALRWHIVRILPLPVESGSRARWLAIATDIHERKEAEQERERLLRQIERERSKLAIQYAVVRVLAEASSLADAAPRLLAALCDQLDWQAGVFWTVGTADSTRRVLSPLHVRQQPDITPAGIIRESQPAPLERGQSLAGRVWQGKKALPLFHLSPQRGAAHHRAAAGIGLRSAFAFPIMIAGEVHGVVELFTREQFEPGESLLDITAAVGTQIGQFMERMRTLDQLHLSEEALIQANNALEQRVRERTAELGEANRELSAEIVERTRLEQEIIRISEREQRRIGQDLHDGLCQELAAITFMTRALANRLDRSGSPETDRIHHIAKLLNDSISRCRDIARGLHPVELDTDGLMVALGELAKRTNQSIACSFQCKEPILMRKDDVALNLYRIAHEAVNNALKHSKASRIDLSLARDGPALRLSICDDGRGIPARSNRSHLKSVGMGLHIMHYRARAVGATLRIQDRQPRGTEIVCLLDRK